MNYCPCGTGKDYHDCCGMFISGLKSPPSPEALMRSRYTAYSQVNIDYIAKTMKSPAADNFDVAATRAWASKINWIQLTVIRATSDGSQGVVEFIAHYFLDKQKYTLHEISEFILENGQWYYVNGTQPNQRVSSEPVKKIGRNDICPCGSSKKFKKCCGHSF